jgi:L-ascorbate metabolism protein UlaG (beta-lactamase superfamily)
MKGRAGIGAGLFLAAALMALLLRAQGPAAEPAPNYSASPQYENGRFRNPVSMPARRTLEMLGIFWRQMFGKPPGTMPDVELPVKPLKRAELDAAPEGSLWKLTHSSVLIKLHGHFWLTDPVFSERASPVQWAGPKRFHRNPIALDDLPPIKAVILSHDHYDHLDHDAILALARKPGLVEHFLMPLGVGDRLREWGVDAVRIRQFDWWQETTIEGVRLVATPAQHFSGRSLTDRNLTLWAGWALIGHELRVFYSGDTGYHAGFKDIGERLGPFDLALMECGAYDAAWPLVHMTPEESVQAHRDVRGRLLVPVHNGSFDLGMHPWREPVERATVAARKLGVPLVAPMFGERLAIRPAADAGGP